MIPLKEHCRQNAFDAECSGRRTWCSAHSERPGKPFPPGSGLASFLERGILDKFATPENGRFTTRPSRLKEGRQGNRLS
jgi:hypothetical protein